MALTDPPLPDAEFRRDPRLCRGVRFRPPLLRCGGVVRPAVGKRARKWVLLGLLLVVPACNDADCGSCGPPETGTAISLPGGQAALAHEGRSWLQGDTHVHSLRSTDADVRSTPERIRETAIREGLEWVIVTDHSNATGSRRHCLDAESPNDCVEQPHLHNLKPEFPLWATLEALSDESFLMVNGNEASPVDLTESTPRGHVNIVPKDLARFDRDWVITDRPSGAVPGGWAVTAAHEHGALAILNHPYSPGGATPWIDYDWTNMDYDAVEVYNAGAGFDPGDEGAVAAALCDWVQGRPVAFVGASDNHRVHIEPPGDILNPALGAARTSVLVPELSWPAVIAAFEARRTVAHDKDTFLELRVRLPAAELLPGDVHPIASPVRATIEVGGWTDRAGTVVVRAVTAADCTDPRPTPSQPPTVAGRVLDRIEVPEGGPAAGGSAGGPELLEFEAELAPGTTLVAHFDREIGGLGERSQAIPSPIQLPAVP